MYVPRRYWAIAGSSRSGNSRVCLRTRGHRLHPAEPPRLRLGRRRPGPSGTRATWRCASCGLATAPRAGVGTKLGARLGATNVLKRHLEFRVHSIRWARATAAAPPSRMPRAWAAPPRSSSATGLAATALPTAAGSVPGCLRRRAWRRALHRLRAAPMPTALPARREALRRASAAASGRAAGRTAGGGRRVPAATA